MFTQLLFASNRLFSTYRTETRGGREYLVVNGVPLVEGVLNKRFVSADEFGGFIQDWNDVPIVLRHPKQNGGSARVPSVDVPVIGRFYNAKLDGTRLVGEYWLDKQLLETNEEGKNLVALISKNKAIETSTGYWSETIPETGKWNGKEYESVDKNIRADHIALLPDEVGACSVADGCGLNRNHFVKNCQTCDLNKTKTNAAAGSYEGKIERVYQAFSKQFDASNKDIPSPVNYWIVETHPNHVICVQNGEYFSVGYSEQDGEIIFDERSEWKKAVRLEEYVIVQNVTGSLPPEGKKIWEKVYKSALEEYDGDEEKAAATAWSAVKKVYEKKHGTWTKKETKQNRQDLEGLAVALLLAEV